MVLSVSIRVPTFVFNRSLTFVRERSRCDFGLARIIRQGITDGDGVVILNIDGVSNS